MGNARKKRRVSGTKEVSITPSGRNSRGLIQRQKPGLHMRNPAFEYLLVGSLLFQEDHFACHYISKFTCFEALNHQTIEVYAAR